jgi:mRNA interferase RelE/StbE
MNVEITKKFQKQVANCTDNRIKSEIKQIIEKANMAKSVSEIKNIKKLKGHKNIFRIRLGDYRIGLVVSVNSIVFAAFDHRSDIYKYFP